MNKERYYALTVHQAKLGGFLVYSRPSEFIGSVTEIVFATNTLQRALEFMQTHLLVTDQ